MLKHPSRIDQLNIILQYCSEKNKTFTKGERICINQERGYLLTLRSPNPIIIKVFDYSDLLEYKMLKVMEEIKKTNWKPYEEININWDLE